MTRPASLQVAAPSQPPMARDSRPQQAQQGDAPASLPETGLITAPAATLTPRQFLDALGLSSPEQRAARQAETEQQCIRAIERGDLYGWPPMLVAHCRAIIAERVAILDLAVTKRADGSATVLA